MNHQSHAFDGGEIPQMKLLHASIFSLTQSFGISPLFNSEVFESGIPDTSWFADRRRLSCCVCLREVCVFCDSV